MSLARTNFRSGIVRQDFTTSADAAALITISFPAFGGNLATMLYAQVASTPGTVEASIPLIVTPTVSFSGDITWLKIWSSTTSAAGATLRMVAGALTGSI